MKELKIITVSKEELIGFVERKWMLNIDPERCHLSRNGMKIEIEQKKKDKSS